ncbi:MAG: lysophospholipid acyltransferase family protein [Verrucomicrobiaceae bacterium]|nr:lysophospholipid acyltransferase family protein [Verrucomicrobiaceae bacterium]
MLIDLSARMRSPLQKSLYRLAGPMFEKTFGLRDMNEVYARAVELYHAHPQGPSPVAWFDSALKAREATYDAETPPDFEIPKSGPLIVVANHPFGILDPCVLAHFVASHRPDLRVMANSLLEMMTEVKPWIIPVDVFGGAGAIARNLGPMKDAIRHLRGGGALAVFPSGEVAHWKLARGIEESPWSSHIGSLVRRTGATVLPVYFPGRNSALFQAAGLVHPMLRTGMLLHEFRRGRDKVVNIRVGHPIPFSRLKKFENDEALTKYLRMHTMVLDRRQKASDTQAAPVAESAKAMPPVAPMRMQQHFRQEVDRLRDQGARLVGQGPLSVYMAYSHEIPHLLREIGRQREITFRAVGEGSGQEIDIDRFDSFYLHAFLWDDEKEQLAGAYRLGRADLILREYGPKGLYTSTLFRFEKPFLAHLESAVELGRSFISSAYQRNLVALPLLWKGITQWMCRNPHYKKLFGPVSISKDYDLNSRRMLVEFLKDNNLHPDLATFVKPRHPFRYRRGRKLMREFISANLQDVDDCSALISSIETDGKGIPILLKHYLRMNGTILSFNVDKDFSSVIDGLILVDLTETDPKLLSRYMGEDNCRAFLAKHGVAFDREPAAK